MIRRYLLDTGIAHDFLHDRRGVRTSALEQRKLGHRLGICVPVLGELWAGVEGSASRQRNLERVQRTLSQLVVWPYTSEAAAEYGRIFADLRRRGRPMQQVDMQIAAIARTLPNCIVVSSDSDLLEVPGLAVENWAK